MRYYRALLRDVPLSAANILVVDLNTRFSDARAIAEALDQLRTEGTRIALWDARRPISLGR